VTGAAPPARPRRIAFLGFGLIAGSIARSVAAAGSGLERPTLVGWSPSGVGPGAATRDGVLDAAADTPAEALDGADLVVLGAPPLETIELLSEIGGALRGSLAAKAVVTDVASTKARVVAAADAAGLRFVGGHPMAGREASGYAAAVPDLFADRPWVLVPGSAADDDAVAAVEWLVVACGARPVRMTAAAHDAAAARVSHLPLVVAAVLAEAVAGARIERSGWAEAAPLAASGWRDMTRLARGDVRMGAGIGATNAAPLVEGLGVVRAVLDRWIDDLTREGGPDPAGIEARLRAVRDRLEREPGEAP
jgi:prephenate dehydrogenase